MKISAQIKILLADDHEIYRDGLVAALGNCKKYVLAGVCSNGEQLLQHVHLYQPDVVITDLKMPVLGGIEAIQRIHNDAPSVRILVLSNFDSEYLIVDALRAGAVGYLTKSMPKKDLFEAIDSVYQNVPYYCKTTSAKLAKMLHNNKYSSATPKSLQMFTDFELQVIRQICEGKSCQESGELLFLSARTIEGYRSKIFKKMGVKTIAEVAIYAVKHNLFLIEDE
jgi:DNA-binding NarL/FixJ family response regulator